MAKLELSEEQFGSMTDEEQREFIQDLIKQLPADELQELRDWLNEY
jgi:hypothetical protein